ncbi:MobF family relaxase [Ilumatobacter sp.]|uniref:MobF family relaxase n=1 Tax=Ilumatobacter sp. TaxID=1967498 RepID=UPI003B51777E
MLSLWKLRVGAEAYYLGQVASGLDDYYTAGAETQGRWIGTGAALLNLVDEVTGDDLRAVLAGLSPGTGLSPNGTQIRTWKGRVPGFDLTFSTPKSVSVMYAFGDVLVRNEIVEALDAAVRESIGWLEREACFVRRGSNNRNATTAPFEQFGTRQLPGSGFIAAGFDHRTSRAGDPQLHTHVLVANLAQGPDGRWTALDGQALYRSKIAAGTVFQTALRHELSRRLGIDWTPVHNGVADIAGISKQVLKHFSKRRNEIEDELERSGRAGAAAAAQVTLATRTAKLDVDQATLDRAWLDDGTSIGFGPADINQLLASCRPIAPTAPPTPASMIDVRRPDPHTGASVVVSMSIDDFAARVAHHLPDRNARITRHEIQNAVADHLTRNTDSELLERLTDAVLAHPELVPFPAPDQRPVGWGDEWTTRRLLQLEAELIDLFQPNPTPDRALDADFVDTMLAALGRTLGADQADTLRCICTQGNAVEVIVGRAGTGKTYTMRTVNDVYTAAGQRLVGVCPTARAARELGDGAGIESFTVPRFLTNADLDSNTIVVVDEAAMCGTVDLHTIVTRAHQVGAKVILVGDHHQLPEIAAGGGFRAALAAVGDQRCELKINRRQRHEWEHAALDHLRNGDLATFWNTYQQHDRVVLAGTAATIRQRAIDDWWTSHTIGASAHLIAGTRAEAKLLNALARHRAHAAGFLSGPELQIRSRSFQVGDRVVLLKNMHGQRDLDTGRECRVDNGMIATITHIDHTHSVIDLALVNGRRLRIDGEYVQGGNIDHGYATTIHKAQGLTCDDIFVVGPAGLYRESGYVALSRARNTARLYATTRDAATIGERGHTTGIPLPTENVDDPEHDLLDTLERSHAKEFALASNPHLDTIADTANTHDLAQLDARRRHISTVTHRLRADGLTDPRKAVERLQLAISHRTAMHVGNRVNALDWDNVGTIEHLHDSTGLATIRFTTSDGQRTNTRTLPWEQLKPIDHPEPAELTDLAERYLTELSDQIHGDVNTWNRALFDRGVEPHEPTTVPAAVAQRERKLFHRLRATPPEWLSWWTGHRPTNATAAVVYDDHLRALASWRDRHQLPDQVPGFGPIPHDPADAATWRSHMDQGLATRQWLTERTSVEPERPPTISVKDARERITELDVLFEKAPADQRKIVDALLTSPDVSVADKIDTIQLAGAEHQARRDWILEHWPNIIEHHELTAIVEAAGPLGHWPVALPAKAQQLLDEVIRTSIDTPEERTLTELDEAVASQNPARHISRLERDLKPLRRTIREFDGGTVDSGEGGMILARAHVERLRERAQEIEAEIARAETESILNGWSTRTDPELSAAITRRVNHLTHVALVEGDPLVASITSAVSDDDPAAGANDVRAAIARAVADRERSGMDLGAVERPAPIKTRQEKIQLPSLELPL